MTSSPLTLWTPRRRNAPRRCLKNNNPKSNLHGMERDADDITFTDLSISGCGDFKPGEVGKLAMAGPLVATQYQTPY